MNYSKYTDLLLVTALILIAVLFRTVWHIAPNVEFVTAAALAGGYFLSNKKFALFIPLSIMFISDLIIGNTMIYLFTWSGFLFPALLGVLLKRLSTRKRFKNLFNKEWAIGLVAAGSGFFSTLFFFFWTNLGVVLVSPLYQKTLAGLLSSYINALPFLRNQLVGNLVIVPLIFITVMLIFKIFRHKSEQINYGHN